MKANKQKNMEDVLIEKQGLQAIDHLIIRDKESGQELLNKRG